MLGKGLKRKLEQEEENAVNKMRSPQEVSSNCYWIQRQTVLNLSLLKLHSRPAHSDPGLARRVLITNTLRHIQEELRVEEVLLPQSVLSPGSPLGVIKGSWERTAGCGVESPARTEGGLTPVSLLEEDRHLFLSLHSSVALHTLPSVSRHPTTASSIAKDSFASALAEIEDLCPNVGTTASLDLKMASPTSLGRNVPDITSNSATVGLGSSEESRQTDVSDMDSNMGSGLSQLHHSLLDSTQSVFNHTPSLLTDFTLDDFLFTEIDNILFDNTPCSSTLSTASGTSKVVSMVTDDIVKTLTGFGSGGMSQPVLPPNQTFKLDLNELDHLLEVLVGS
ncbi:SERTA domain-containing protein 2 [Xyrauchen texanus]|uniref:SERTA domain-containing protein 2 n=1 Tax=Xyrauchen texanus TaxID=154827 RepID=UPI002241A473|nr:SERTA domain-containing protein 2 [Xyrauchen texanus]